MTDATATANPATDSDEDETTSATSGKKGRSRKPRRDEGQAGSPGAQPADAESKAPEPKEPEPSTGRKAYNRAFNKARRLRRAEPENVDGVLTLLGEAAGHMDPGPERAIALAQTAALQLRDGRLEAAIDTLLTPTDWPHHTAAGLRTLEQAAVRAKAQTPIRWLATRPTSGQEPSLDAVDHALILALRQGSIEFAESLAALATELAPAGHPLPPLLDGLVHDKTERTERAILEYSKAIDLGSSDGRCHRRLVFLLEKVGRTDEARQVARSALERGPALSAPTRQQLEKALIRLEDSPSGERRKALAKMVPLYLHIGEATIERIARFPVAPAKASQADSLVAALGSRAGTKCAFLRDAGEELALDMELPVPAQRVLVSPRGGHCLVIHASKDDDTAQAMAITVNGPTSQCTLPASPHRALALTDHCVLAYRDGTIESRSWTGERRWKIRLGKHGFAYWLAGGDERLIASYLDGIYEIDPAMGDVTGPMTIYDEPSEGVRGPAEGAEFSSAWVQGLGAVNGQTFALVRGGFYEVLTGPRLLLRERISPDEPVDRVLSDPSGRLTALQGGGYVRTVGPDGRLSEALPSPVEGRGVAHLKDDRVALYGGRLLTVMDPTGETHRLEAVTPIRSVCAIDETSLCVATGRDVLAVTLG